MNIKNDMKAESKSDITKIIIIGVIIFIVGVLLWLPGGHHTITKRTICASNMKFLGLAFLIYFNNNGSYPTPEKWCDLIISEMEKSGKPRDIKDLLQCPEAEIRDVNCHYAMNPNCTTQMDVSGDTVLLFETKNGGWNLTGGPELMTTENHKEKVCNVLFNDGTVERIKKEEIANLKW